MARENQRLQVGLIICIMLIVVLISTTFFGFRSANEYGKLLDSEKKRADEAEQVQRQFSSKLQYVTYMVGASDTTLQALEAAGIQLDEQMTKVKQQFDEDMKQYGEGLAEADRNYRSVCNNLVTALRTANEQLTNADGRVKQALADLNQKVDELTKRAQSAEGAQKKAEDELMAQLQSFKQDREKFLAQTQADVTKLGDLQKEKDDAVAAADRITKERDTEIQKRDTTIDNFRAQLEQAQKESFEVPYGRIVTVNQDEHYVWINLGHLDGLRPQTSFSVHGEKTSAVEYGKPKARIEVTRVLDNHLAEARIVEDLLTDPIMRGDVIYTPAWQPGRKMQVGLAGFMDLNGDGLTDRDAIKRVIGINGGEVVAELQNDGTVQGKLDVGVRFLVIGDAISEKDNPKVREAYSSMLEEAERLGIKAKYFKDFLLLMGWKSEAQTTNLGAGGQSIESNTFRPRQPPAPAARGENGGAF